MHPFSKNFLYKVTIGVGIFIIILAVGSFFYAKEIRSRASGTNSAFKVSLENVSPITEADHILGPLSASVKIVTYSDTECPYCKTLYRTFRTLYGNHTADNKVAIVFRHFPLDTLYPKGRVEAEALECAAKLGGNTAFWNYLDRLFTITPSENKLDLTKLPEVASFVGLPATSFKDCQSTNDFSAKINQNLGEAEITGGRLRPWNVVIFENGSKISFSGPLPLQTLEQIIASKLKY